MPQFLITRQTAFRAVAVLAVALVTFVAAASNVSAQAAPTQTGPVGEYAADC